MASERMDIIFPFSEAARFSVESIRRRFTRALITVVSVVLGIAFFVALMTMGEITLKAVAGGAEGVVGVQAYQIWLSIIALLVCGVGIVNSMLMSITERYKEIGTIKCLGAMDRHILEIFLIESALVGMLGGLVGSFAGWGVAVGIQVVQASNRAAVIAGALSAIQWVGWGILISVILSLLASVLPSYIAARLNPAEALRYEV